MARRPSAASEGLRAGRVPGFLRGLGTDERGISSVIVAICIAALFGAAMLTIDSGNVWQVRRSLTGLTDGAALAEADGAVASGAPGVCAAGSPSTQILAGDPAAELSECTPFAAPGSRTGYVRVGATKPAQVRFGAVLGVKPQTVTASSSAMWGFITRAKGLRPIALFLSNPHLVTWMAGLPASDELPTCGVPQDVAPGVHRIFYDGTLGGCGWAFVDFDGGASSDQELSGWIAAGYSSQVGIGDCFANGSGQPCPGMATWTRKGVRGALDTAEDSGHPFPILAYASTLPGAGATAYVPAGFVGVKLDGYQLEHSPFSLDLEFTNLTVDGNCCFGSGVETGVEGVRLCSADHDPVPEDQGCAPSPVPREPLE